MEAMASIQRGLLQAFAAIHEHFGDAVGSGPFPKSNTGLMHANSPPKEACAEIMATPFRGRRVAHGP